jgi:SAM-dependent methyltransferase
MHQSAVHNCRAFFETYSKGFGSSSNVKVVEIGSQDVNGSLRQICPKEFDYVGLDFQDAKGVDIVLDDPYSLPLANESVDIVLSSSCFEHSEMFWLVFLEVLRVLKPGGLFYLNVPSAGNFHRYPVDCWRFYPDSGKALITWAKRNGINATMLESYTQRGEKWQDFVAVFLKDESLADRFPARILGTKTDFENGQLFGEDGLFNESWICQNDKKLQTISQLISEQIMLI